jgi:hypothetical protein
MLPAAGALFVGALELLCIDALQLQRQIVGILRAVDRRDEPVAPPGQRLVEARLLCIVAQRRPQPLDRRVQAVLEVDEGVLGPSPASSRLLNSSPPPNSQMSLPGSAFSSVTSAPASFAIVTSG